MRLLRAWADAVAAMLEAWAADMRETAKKLPEREYFRGYRDAIEDHRLMERPPDG